MVMRFWYSKDEFTMPNTESLMAAASWVGFHQIIYTNVPTKYWLDLSFATELTTVPYTSDFDSLDLAPQILKDFWQFKVAELYDGVWCVDFDFYLMNRNQLPKDPVVVATEWVKSSGGQCPKEIARYSV